jgi:hypothetical protein
MYYTYLHINDKGVFYVGYGNIKRPWDLRHRSTEWKRIAHEGFSVEVVSSWKNREEAWEHEKYLIKHFRKSLINISDGGPGKQGMTGEKCCWYGKTHTEATKDLMSFNRSGPKNAMYGVAHTLESRLAMGQSRNGLSLLQLKAIREDKRTHKKIAQDYQISRNYVTNIKNGKRGKICLISSW